MKRNFWTLVWLLVVGWPAIYGQTIPIEGVVLDSITRQPLPGATVVVRPAERGTTTDGGGRFTLSVPVLPQRLSISYVGYGPVELELNERPADPLLIVLRPEATELEQVVVSPDNQPLPLSDGDEYVVVDFALTGERMVVLEYYGVFKGYQLTLIDEWGRRQGVVALGHTVKGEKSLYKSCQGNVFLLVQEKAIRLQHDGHLLTIADTIHQTVFDKLVRPCVAANEEYTYYEFEFVNGLVREYRWHDKASLQSGVFRVVASEDQLANFSGDMGLMYRGSTISNIGDISADENFRIRRLQAERDFLVNVFYKPELPVFLWSVGDRLWLFNHPQGYLEQYDWEGQFEDRRPIDYGQERRWRKELYHDEQTGAFYLAFHHPDGIRWERLDPSTGERQPAGVLPAAQPERLQLSGGIVYFLEFDHWKKKKVLKRWRMEG